MVNRLSSKPTGESFSIEAGKALPEGAVIGPDGVARAPERVVTRGDNNPPSLVELLLDELTTARREEFAKVDPLRDRANAAVQKIETDDHLASWTAIYNDARELHRRLDEQRKADKRPYTEAIEELYEPRLAPLETIMAWIKKAADAYNRAKVQKQREAEALERARIQEQERQAKLDDTDGMLEQAAKANEAREQAQQTAPVKAADVARVRAEGGGVAAAGTVWKFTIDDYSKVDLNAIRHLIPAAAIDKAVATIVKAQKGATRIEGVKVYEDVATSFRR
jgi:hypothetical protein